MRRKVAEEGGNMCVHIPDSLCCAVEINTSL